jgi:hypothetical protein
MMTMARLISSVACTSCSDARMVGVPSKKECSCTPPGSHVCICGISAFTRSTVSMTLASAFLYTYIRMPGRPLNHAAW